jgi:hypothetical protein
MDPGKIVLTKASLQFPVTTTQSKCAFGLSGLVRTFTKIAVDKILEAVFARVAAYEEVYTLPDFGEIHPVYTFGVSPYSFCGSP